MKRRHFVRTLVGLATAPLVGCASPLLPEGEGGNVEPSEPTAPPELFKLRSEWRQLLSRDVYEVLFEGRTEPPGTSHLNHEHRSGTYICAACFIPLFSSEAKYDSGTGWPSFWDAFEERLGFRWDFALPVPRTEYHCRRCGGHHGHVFADGPPPTGLRYCNNGLALSFTPLGEPIPDPRT